MFNTIRSKVSLLYSSILCLILISFSAYLFQTVRHTLYKNVEDELRIKAEQINGIIDAYAEMARSDKPHVPLMRQFLSQQGKISSGKEIIDELWAKDSRSLGLAQDEFRILNLNGQPVLRSVNLTRDMDHAFGRDLKGPADAVFFAEISLKNGSFYTINYPFMFSNGSEFIMQLATPLAVIQKTLSQLLMFMIGGVLVILLMTVFMGAFLTRKILEPVMEVTKTANNISQKNLAVRITGRVLDDEMGLLVASFNKMIERLEKSFMHVNEFSSQVAHELKTPLAIMKGELELALSTPGLKDEEARVMSATLQEVDRLTRIVKDLLLLARFEYKLDVFKMERLDLGGFLKEFLRRVQGLADEKRIFMDLSVPEEPFFIQGDAVHLKRLFFNLVHNAIKFTPSGGTVRIAVAVKDGKACVEVADTGEGIAPADHAKVFEKFYRVRKAGQQDSSGTGLGLAMALSIARAHGGEILLASELAQGATFTVVFPL